ncbi:TIGR00730 family Rossman fold protein [Oleiharenicola sp. Vm1]|uniref:LOG family protein n=1 Tax=Oleiharenicola sp. Vm1 TaxID=3398393 RepID=UPI0039F6013B
MKSLCVYCSSSDRLEPKYAAAAEQVGREIARRGWALVYGGGKTGLMGSVARGTKAGGGKVIGVIPEFMKARELEFTEADELISVLTMRERKMLMETRADAFLALPGGWGTLEELLEILTLAHLEVLQKPIVILNQDGYYDDLLRMFERIVDEKFMRETIRGKFAVARTIDEIFPLIDGWTHQPGDAKWYQTR